MKKVTDELIGKFFRQQCTPEERSAVSAYFDQYPEELDKYFSEEEWNTFDESAKLHPAISKEMLDEIERHIDKEAPKKWINFRTISIAASIIIILGITLFFNLNKGKNGSMMALLTNRTAPSVNQFNDTVYNNTPGLMRVVLKDSSVVTLSAKSKIIYQHLFTQKNRDIYLNGEAIFKVAKDKSRPFTVYAGGLSTTALGTRFKVSATDGSNKTSVELYEGKVVVKQYQHPDSGSTYLTPGRMLVFDKNSHTVKVSEFNQTQPDSSPVATGTTYIHDSIIKFQNQSLFEVINVLRKAYHIRINMDSTKLNNRYFSGDVNTKTEKPEEVIKTIATLNKLVVNKQNGAYTLSQ